MTKKCQTNRHKLCVPLCLSAHMQANCADRSMTQHAVTLVTLLAPSVGQLDQNLED
jgi:hypothetical protein